MPKGRMLNKRISVNKQLEEVSIEAALLFTWCIPHLDSSGRIHADPQILKGVVIPYRKEITLNNIPKLCQELQETGLVKYYGTDHKYMEFSGFMNNQTINPDREAESEIPTPDLLQSNTGLTPAKVKLSKVNISKGEIPPSLEEVTTYCKERKNGVNPNTFINHYQSNGWLVGKNRMKDWRAAVRTWEGRSPVVNKPQNTEKVPYKSEMIADPDTRKRIEEMTKGIGKV